MQDRLNQYYLTIRLVRDGQTVNAAVYVAESDGLEWQELTHAMPRTPATWMPGL
jgi:hypothetical protein